MKKLTVRQQAFVAHLFGDCAGNATRAARAAGFSAKTARQAGARLLSNVDIQRAIRARTVKRQERFDFNLEKRNAMLQQIADANVGMRPAVSQRSIDILNKVEGIYSKASGGDSGGKYEDLLAESRKPRP